MSTNDKLLNYRAEAKTIWVSLGLVLLLAWGVWMEVSFMRHSPIARTRWEWLGMEGLTLLILMQCLYYLAQDLILKSKRVEVRISGDRAEVIETTCLGQRSIEVSTDDAPALSLNGDAFRSDGLPKEGTTCTITLGAQRPQPRQLKFGKGLYRGEIHEIHEALKQALKIDTDKP